MTQYHVSRNGKQLGIYPEDRTKEYFSQGRIGPNDLIWREGMAAWMPASQVFGPATEPSFPGEPPLPAAAPPSGQDGLARSRQQPVAPLPPKLHWALVLLLTLVTFGIFYVVWMFVQSAWVRRIDPDSNATTFFIVYLVLVLFGQVMAEAGGEKSGAAAVGTLLVFAGAVVSIFGFFSMRRSMLNYYNQTERIDLKLSGAMTFFFNVLYLQHHMTRIAKWKRTGALPPQ